MAKTKQEEKGFSLDDAFAGDEDVEYAPSKPKKVEKKKIKEEVIHSTEHSIKSSKPIEKIKKGDKIKVDGKTYEVDAHYMLIDHGTTKEMAIELFLGEDDFQLRYFSDNIDTLQFYKLDKILYVQVEYNKIEW